MVTMVTKHGAVNRALKITRHGEGYAEPGPHYRDRYHSASLSAGRRRSAQVSANHGASYNKNQPSPMNP